LLELYLLVLERDQELKKEMVQLFMQKNSSNVVYLWRVNKLVKQGLHLCHAFFDELGKAFGVLHEKIKKEQFYNWRVAGEKNVITQHLRKEEEDQLLVTIICTS